MKTIVIINGPPRAGKDTFVSLCKELSTFEVINLSSVDMIKMVAQILGWDGQTKDEESRKFLSDLKDLSTKYNDGPTRYLSNQISSSPPDSIVFCHIREPYDIEKLRLKWAETSNRIPPMYKIHTLLIDRNTETYNNHADKNVRDYDYEFVIDNNYDLTHLAREAKKFLKKIEKPMKGELV